MSYTMNNLDEQQRKALLEAREPTMSEQLAESVALTIGKAKEHGLSRVTVNINLLEAVLERLYENASLTEKVERLQKTNGEFRKQVALLKEHLGPEGNYSIHRADGETMWLGETFIIGNIFEALDALLAKDGE